MESTEILNERRGSVLSLSINRPTRRNALTVAASKLLRVELLKAVDDTSVRVLVLRGRGDDFCCGADIGAAVDDDGGADEHLADDPEPYQVAEILYNMPMITIAAIRGGCAGAAIGWACACDIRIAGTSARFNTAFLDVPMAGDMAGAWFLTRLLGPTKARELYYLPRKFDAHTAYSIGMLTQTCEDSEFENTLGEVTARLSSSAPLALRAMKANFLDAERSDLKSYMVEETRRHIALYGTADRREAFQAYLEKRKPSFGAG